ncbi:hypothetical protein AB4254_07990 [Vibrio breoganii]
MSNNNYTKTELFELATSYNKSWEENSGFKWNEAEHLVEASSTLDADVLSQCPAIQELLNYAQDEDEWDCGDIGNWPSIIIKELNETT